MDDLSPAMDLPAQLLILLREQPQGFSEFELIQQLKRRHCTHIPNLPLTDKLVLFRTHFLLFNALYQLRDQLWQDAGGHLHITALCIQLHPYDAGTCALVEEDPLRAYYLDLSNLRDTDEPAVERLLASFWTRMQGGEDKRAALELFELDRLAQPLDMHIIKQRYRQLVSQHHPDRGGSTQRLQSINLALEILQRYYR
ncbi:DNA-J related domain-containing protein [Stutzerimonas degradans]|uniref:Molecular chaperone DnaJ n=1 Tax=Stutzerimonas degradans TaxID=2968968 RepID=A0A8E2QC99_9GAMM|nr:DNA-J related domain-containing protein [Stutzerimonas degradans]MCQ4275189.1 molecular chaperone DnaJ [Stutzerimonas degradans]PNF76164.1 molecular chaperone DnaJ [Stutzerimonas degradans]QPT21855.1 molecular chaperone DnaJ [Stutzerimonas degradans]